MKEKIVKKVSENKEEVIKFLQKLVSIDTQVINQGIDGKEGKAQKLLATEFRKLGADVCLFEPDNNRLKKYADFNPGHSYKNRPNMVAVFKGKGKSLILNGHIDTVSYGNRTFWKYNPLEPKILNGQLYGLGACDMKSGLATMIMAIKILKKSGISFKSKIIFESVVDEEGGGNGTLACVDRGYNADAAIIAEPTSLKICAAHRGAMHLLLKVKGVSTHAAIRNKGVNAIENMIKVIKILESLDKKWQKEKKHPLLPAPAITVCYISGGTGASIVPNECEAKINVKYLPGENSMDIQKEIRDRIIKEISNDTWLKKNPPELTCLLNTSPYETSVSNPLVKNLEQSAEEIIGHTEVTGLPSGSDARILNNIGKIPTFIFGPGNLSQAHQPNESILISEYLNAITIFILTILRWDSGKEKIEK